MHRKTAFLALAVVAAVVAAYLPALDAGFVWNDDTYLTENRTLDTLEGLKAIWTEPKANEQYYPAVFTSFWIEKHLWGLRPFGYHLVNVLLHAGSALLLWGLLVRLGLPGGWFAAAVFALHPVCVESVAWVTERKNTLSLFLSLLAMLAYLAGREKKEEKTGDFLRKGKRGRAAQRSPATRPPAAARRRSSSFIGFLGFLFFLLALLAKTTAVVVPAVLLVLVWLRRGKIAERDVGPILPWFAAGIALAAHTAWLERTVVQAAGAEWALSLAQRIVLAGSVLLFYSRKFFFPTDLSFFYERWTVDARRLVQWLPALAALLALALAWRFRGRFGRGPLAGLVLFFGALFPAMGFFNVYAMRYSWVADHFAYQAVAVLSACAVCGIASWLVLAGPAARRAVSALAVALLALFGTLTFRHSASFRDPETLWKDTLERSPGCFMCHTNYGNWLMEHGREAEAVLHFEKSLALRPDNIPTLLNLARLDESHGRLEAAAVRLRTALKIDPRDTAVLINLGTVSTKAGRVDEAITSYEEALRIGSPEDYLAHNGLGVALAKRGSAAEAVEHFREALRLRPDYEFARANLERVLSVPGGPDAGAPRPPAK